MMLFYFNTYVKNSFLCWSCAICRANYYLYFPVILTALSFAAFKYWLAWTSSSILSAASFSFSFYLLFPYCLFYSSAFLFNSLIVYSNFTMFSWAILLDFSESYTFDLRTLHCSFYVRKSSRMVLILAG